MSNELLLTGGAGFIGSALARLLVGRSSSGPAPRVTAVDCLHPQVHPTQSRPAGLPDSAELVVMDVCDGAEWDRVLERSRASVVIHLAAETGTAQSFHLPTRHTHTNVTGTAEMIEAFDRAGQVPAHVVLTSSRAIYGEGCWQDPRTGNSFSPGHRSRDALEAGEFRIFGPSGAPAQPLPQSFADTPPSPVSVYGATKLSQEHLLRYWCAAKAIPLTILRLQNVYGPGQSPHNPYTGIIGLFHRAAAAGQAIEVYEDGEIGRDFIYIDDVAQWIAAAIDRPPPSQGSPRLLDVGSGAPMTILKAARTIAGLYRAPEPWISGAFRIGDVRWAMASTEALENALGSFSPVSFREGNLRLARWLRAQG